MKSSQQFLPRQKIWQMKWLCIIRRLKNGQKKNEKEHVDNDRAVRKMLLDRGIVPENS